MKNWSGLAKMKLRCDRTARGPGRAPSHLAGQGLVQRSLNCRVGVAIAGGAGEIERLAGDLLVEHDVAPRQLAHKFD
eukprot:CAMPEP_0202061332 /NCGR_PEP_ID=MMETSP0963-20130614/40724_1 /ASSEMBLY_ACC=CAM_ASM_000494 /TAXON_ID=4773 /ORGANISM="Schizochytrium aggregatum, Strain ATCC28209" /LENGTH=76 /DNA_ID=CAMNT_0048627519 /DNA_START=88 /DNA_END=315 /DNA_ORIENTATION=+